jgi:4-amino-4-deoxy-L-arabinose transferase-like glycosyltransferase
MKWNRENEGLPSPIDRTSKNICGASGIQGLAWIFSPLRRAIPDYRGKWRLPVLAAIAILSFILIINNSWRASPDSALYLSLSKSVAQGKGFVYNGVQHTFVPPGFPYFLAAVSSIGGDGFVTYRFTMALLGLLAAGAGYLFVRKIVGPEVAFVIGGIFLLNHELLHDSTMILADAPFALAFLIAMNLLLWSADSRISSLKILLTAAVFGLLPIIRINGIGVPPFAAFFLFCAWKSDRKTKRWFWSIAFLAMSVAPFIMWQIWKASFPVSDFEGSYGGALAGNSVAENMRFIALGFLASFSQITFNLAGVSIKTGFVELFLPLVMYVGMVVAFTRGDRLFVPLLIVQLPVIALAGFGSRYLLFMTPLLYLFTALGLLQVSRFVSGFTGRVWDHGRVVVACFAVMALMNFGHNMLTISLARNTLENGGAQSERSLPYFQAGKWLKANAVRSPVLTSCPRIIHYLSECPVVPLVNAGAPNRKRLVDNPKELEALMKSERPQFLFADSKRAELFRNVIGAMKSLGYDLVPISDVVSSSRFKLYRIAKQKRGS